MADVEILRLSEFDPELKQRDFDAVSYGRFYWRGILKFEPWESEPEVGSRVTVFSDRDDPLGDDYATKPGVIEEVTDEEKAKALIAKAIEECFDHSITVEVLPDGNGGWISLETDT